MSKTRDLADSAEVINFLDGVTSNIQTQITSNSDSLSTVATTGSYNDLSDLPTIPVDVSELTDTTQLLTHFDGDYNSLTNTPTIPSLTGYATETYVDTAVGAINPDPTKATLSKTFLENESYLLTLSEPITSGCPVVSVAKEIPQTGITNNSWDVNSTTENYTRIDSAYDTTLGFIEGSNLSALPYITYSNNSFNYSAQDTNVREVEFKNDGTKMYLMGDALDTVYQYSLSTAWDVSTATYDSVSYSVSTGSTVAGFCISQNGLKLYVSGLTDKTIYEHTLSTAWDLSTASSTASQTKTDIAGTATGLDISSDGTKIYILDYSSTQIDVFPLSTPYSITSAGTISSYTVTGANSIRGISFSENGKIIAISNNTNGVTTFGSLTTAFDLSTVSWNGTTINPSSQTGSTVYGLNIRNADKVYYVSSSYDTLYEYDAFIFGKSLILGTGSFASADVGKTIEVNSGELVLIATDGSYVATTAPTSYDQVASGDWGMYCVVYNAADGDLQLSGTGSVFPTGYHAVHTTASIDSTYWTDINSMTADQVAGDGNVYYAISTDDRTTWTVIDNTDGERDVVRNNGGTWQYNSNTTYASETWTNGTTNTELATLAEAMEGAASGGYDISSPSYDSVSFSANAQESFTQSIVFKDDGTKLYVTGSASDTVYQYTLTTAFDLSTASYDSVSFSVSAQDAFPRGLAFSSDGSKMYMAGIISDSVYQYSLSTNWDLSTASYDSVSFSVSGQDGTTSELKFNSIGTKMYILGDANDAVFQYTLSSAWDLSTASYDSVSFSVASQDNTPTALLFSADGSKMFVCGNQNESIYQYTLSTVYDVSTASYDSVSFSVTAQANNPTALAFNSNGSKLYLAQLSGVIYQYTIGAITYPNQMDKTQLDAVTDPNHIALGNDLDLAIVFNMTSGTTVPSSDGVAINYDANVLNKGAVLGTDYDFDIPAQDKVRVTALNAGNYKVRIV